MSTRTVRFTVPPRRDERFATYLAVAGVATVLGMVGDGLRLAVVAVPFAVVAALGVRRRDPAPVAVRVTIATDRCLEGDTLDGVVEVTAPARYDVELAIDAPDDSIGPIDDESWAWRIPASVPRPVGVPIAIRAHRWGEHRLGPLRIRLVDPGSMYHREIVADDLPSVTVLPRSGRSEALVALPSARAHAGAHRAHRSAADGYEFSEVRPYQAGDRMRDLNWAATLRRDEPHVNRRTPELSGDLVILLDSFPDALRRHSVVARDAITWSGRAAWAIATAHLRTNDRVGMAIEGSRLRWMSPRAGRRAQLDIFRLLLAFAASTADRSDPGAAPDRVHMPPGALVLAITPLARRHTIDRLVALRAAGHRVDVIAVDVGPLLDERLPSLPSEVSRLRRLGFEERVAAMRRHGIPTRVVVPDAWGGPITERRDDVG
jgi:uncharacterized protein (DUF58 family)